MNIRTGFGSEVHKAKQVPFVIHSRFGKLSSKNDGSPIFIPACSGIRTSLSLDHLNLTDEPVTCQKCGC